MSLVPDYGDSASSSDSTSDESEPEQIAVREWPPKPKLPTPNFLGGSIDDSKSSVFKNPFTEAENEKEAILQRHVKMVDAKDNVIIINGKKICWNYRKGRCRFGHNCKFAHDSDLQKTSEQIDHEKQAQKAGGVVCHSKISNMPQPTGMDLERIRMETLADKQQTKGKKRPGLSQGLVPGKKVMKKYQQQQHKKT